MANLEQLGELLAKNPGDSNLLLEIELVKSRHANCLNQWQKAAADANQVFLRFSNLSVSSNEALMAPLESKADEIEIDAIADQLVALDAEEPASPPPPAPEPEPVAPQKPKPVEKAPSSAMSPASSSQSPAQAKAAESAPDISPEELEAFKNDPLIKKALEIFQAEILDGGKTA